MPKQGKTAAREQRKLARQPVKVDATVRRGSGNAVILEIVFLPESAAQLTDQIVHALVRNGRRR